MSCPINPREVLQYLNELGYQNISPQQLKEFMKDLKKLIKYDQRTREHLDEIENINPQTSRDNQDIYTSLYKTGTTASKAKEISKKEKIISVQIKRPPPPKWSKFEESSTRLDQIPNSSRNSKESINYINECNEILTENTDEVSKHRISFENIEKVSSKEIKLQPKASFIRPKMQLKPCKSDPVALYHYYQAEWKRQKIPGQDNHSNLRWIIREKMLGEPDVMSTVPSVHKVKRKHVPRL